MNFAVTAGLWFWTKINDRLDKGTGMKNWVWSPDISLTFAMNTFTSETLSNKNDMIWTSDRHTRLVRWCGLSHRDDVQWPWADWQGYICGVAVKWCHNSASFRDFCFCKLLQVSSVCTSSSQANKHLQNQSKGHTLRKAWKRGFCFSHRTIVSLLISKKLTKGG